MQTQVTQSHRETNVVLHPKRDINYPKNDEIFDAYFWQTLKGKRVSVSRLEDAKAAFNAQGESIILQLTSPGFKSTLVMFSPTSALKQPVNLERRQPRVVLLDDKFGNALMMQLEAKLERNFGINVGGASELKKLQDELTNNYTVKTSGDLKIIQDNLRQSEADCIVTLSLERHE